MLGIILRAVPCFSKSDSNKVFHTRCYAHDSRTFIYADHSFLAVPPRREEVHTVLAPRLIGFVASSGLPLVAHHESQVPHLRVLVSIVSVAVEAAVMMARRVVAKCVVLTPTLEQST